MNATVQSIIASAIAEWLIWGQSTWNLRTGAIAIGHTDDENSFAQLVLDKYCKIGGGSPSLLDIRDDRFFWSAVGISAIMHGAGFAKTEFPFAQSHSKFIRHFIAARKSADDRAAYWGFRLKEPGSEPQPGDIVAYARTKNVTAEKAAKLFDATGPYESHTDVVVAKRAGEIDVIGCNVMDSVTKKTLKVDALGHIVDTRHFWFAVLKLRGS